MGINIHSFKLRCIVGICSYQNILKHNKVSFMHNPLGGSCSFLQSVSLPHKSHSTRARTYLASPSWIQPLPLLIRFPAGSDPPIQSFPPQFCYHSYPVGSIAVQAENREASLNRCDGPTSLGAGKDVRGHVYWGNLHQNLFSGSFLLPFCFLQSQSSCFPEDRSASLWEPCSSLSVKKANCNLPVMS